MLGLLTPTSGEILYKGRSLVEILRCDRLAYIKEVQAVFQNPYEIYNPFYHVDRLLEMPIKKFRLARSGGEARALIESSLDAVGLTPERVLGKFPHQLSGGEAQRVAIARALLPRPKLLVADEPVSMVDMSLRAGILNVLLGLKRDFGMSIIFVTHDLSVAYYLSDDIIMLKRGRIVERGGVEKVIGNPLHPYVRELMRSIPIPNPKHRWSEKGRPQDPKEPSDRGDGYIHRFEGCPHPREECNLVAPQLIEIEPNHFVACHYLREDGDDL
jgi:peptide/nickel transport system ATP-binding protein